MARLLIDDEVITERIIDALPYKDIKKIRNKLLGGSYHVRTIGQPLDVIQLTCIMNPSGKALFEQAYIIDQPLRYESEGKFYKGLLSDKPKYKSISVNLQNDSKLYEISFDLVLSEEGVI